MKVEREQDAISFASENDQACVQVFMITKEIDRQKLTLSTSSEDSEVMTIL
jgi:hypothetical protein